MSCDNIDAVQVGNTVNLSNNSAATVTLGSNRQVRFVRDVFHLFCRWHSNILKDNQNSADPKLIDKLRRTIS